MKFSNENTNFIEYVFLWLIFLLAVRKWSGQEKLDKNYHTLILNKFIQKHALLV